ncbi:MAG TPA: hemolysin III family protein [Thermoanaerobaculia bacterium]|nr:hemolysin III family protein [Thermoanaerobaculia bacterium]
MRERDPAPVWSLGEEIAHAVSHGVGVVLAIGGLAGLVAVAAARGDAWHVTASAVFGATLVLLYTASTLYHALPHPRAKRVFRILDHSAIYLAIAGTYTPFALGPLRGPWGWALFGVVWTAAVAGIVFKSVALGRAPGLSVAIYVAMGWCAVFAFGPLVASVAPGGLALLFAGGICYTLGLVFYAWQRLRFHHFVWHLFVLAGSVLHYLAVLLFVIPRPS